MARSQEQKLIIALVAAPVVSAVVSAVVAVTALRITEYVEERRLAAEDDWNLDAEVAPAERPAPEQEDVA